MEPEEFSRLIGKILGSAPYTMDERDRINDAMGKADSIAEFPKDIQQLLSRVSVGGRANPYHDKAESRALSSVERRIVKKPNICKQCAENNDPRKVPVHPHCDCDVVTDSIDTGVADPESRFLKALTPDNIEMELVTGALESAGIQMEPGSVAIMNMDNVRFSDLARWLEQMQPYLDAGAQYVSIVVDDDTQEAAAQVQETVTAIAEDSTDIVEAIQNKKLWFSIAKAVAL